MDREEAKEQCEKSAKKVHFQPPHDNDADETRSPCANDVTTGVLRRDQDYHDRNGESRDQRTDDPLVSDYYRCQPMPERFNHPAWFKGYGAKHEHVLYSTSNNEYGKRPPTVHTMASSFFDKPQKFTNFRATGGMWRNRSLNTYLDNNCAP